MDQFTKTCLGKMYKFLMRCVPIPNMLLETLAVFVLVLAFFTFIQFQVRFVYLQQLNTQQSSSTVVTFKTYSGGLSKFAFVKRSSVKCRWIG